MFAEKRNKQHDLTVHRTHSGLDLIKDQHINGLVFLYGLTNRKDDQSNYS